MLRTLFATIVLGVFVVSGRPARAGVDPGDLCGETKAKAAKKKAFDLMKTSGTNTKKENPTRLGRDISRAQSESTRGVANAEIKGECEPSEDADAIETKVDSVRPESEGAADGNVVALPVFLDTVDMPRGTSIGMVWSALMREVST